ncbi:MAG: DUF3536 domain-containing protein [Bacteroidota bacterium]
MEDEQRNITKYICIHGHFYQPPRENAWLEDVELQDSAHPYHDWNERITAECYAPNTASRILNGEGVIKNIMNNYAKISFNFGPTLLSWLEEKEPETYKAILEADKLSLEHFSGHGSALAQSHGHIIMPLANSRDKETQVIWGIRDFEHRFGRHPEGMWLAESAVDTESLELMAKHGIKFTILAPRQAKAVRKIGEESWQDVSNLSVNTRRPYLCKLPSGRSISLFFYDGDISQAVAFEGLLANGSHFAQRLIGGHNFKSTQNELVHIATDGESYGHHHKHGDMALAYCLDYIDRQDHIALTNYGEYLEKFPPEYEALIQENSSWSCVHGVERWRSNCGCHTGGEPGWTQEWRKPLRDALDWLREALINIYEKKASTVFHDPWEARDGYIDVIMHRKDQHVTDFLAKHVSNGAKKHQALRLLEMQRQALLMYTSCGWFFNEVSGIETTQILQYACRAIQLAVQTNGNGLDLEAEFLARLEASESNIPQMGNAANVYRKYVIPTRLNLKRVGMHYAVASIFEEDLKAFRVFNYTTENEFFEKKRAGNQTLAIGITNIESIVTHSKRRFSFAVLYLGQHNIIGNISIDMEREVFDEMREGLQAAFEESRLGDMIGILQTYFGADKYTIWHLFKDKKRKVLDQIMEKNLGIVENSFRKIYNRDYQLINTLKTDEIPIPKAYRTTLEFVLNADLKRCLQGDMIDLKELKRVAHEFEKWGTKVEDNPAVAKYATQSIYSALKKIKGNHEDVVSVVHLNQLIELLRQFNVTPDLHKSQNLYFSISKSDGFAYQELFQEPEWQKEFEKLGDNLGIKVEYEEKRQSI